MPVNVSKIKVLENWNVQQENESIFLSETDNTVHFALVSCWQPLYLRWFLYCVFASDSSMRPF